MHIYDEPEENEGIPATEIQEVLAELGLDITLEHADEVAHLLESTGDLDAAIAALDELMESYEAELDAEDGYRDVA